MSDAIERARELLQSSLEPGLTPGQAWQRAHEVAVVALDCLEALEGPKYRRQLTADQDLHAEAKRTFKKAINGPD